MFCYKIIGDVLNFSGRKKLRLLLCLFPRSHAPAWERDDDKFSRSQAGGETEKRCGIGILRKKSGLFADNPDFFA